MEKEVFEYIILKTDALIDKIEKQGLKSVCVCGSSRFCDLIAVVKWEMEKRGIVATGLNFLPEWYAKNRDWVDSHHGAEQENVANVLDEVHLRKIDNHECVVIVNFNGYIGERTSIEISYAEDLNKPVYYWE
jgi:hypothetical protein